MFKNAVLLTFLREEPRVEDALYHLACQSLLVNMSRSVTNELVVSFSTCHSQVTAGYALTMPREETATASIRTESIAAERREEEGRGWTARLPFNNTVSDHPGWSMRTWGLSRMTGLTPPKYRVRPWTDTFDPMLPT